MATAPSEPTPGSDPDFDSERGGALSHLAGEGERTRARMVDVGGKTPTRRSALARAQIAFPPGVLARVRAGAGPKGPIEEVARVAGILAAKRTAEWIPLCHPLPLDLVDVEFEELGPDLLEVRCRAATSARTGVEMEALTGASAAALTVYDMVKALDKGVRILSVELLEKTGGKSGTWRAPECGAGGSDPTAGP